MEVSIFIDFTIYFYETSTTNQRTEMNRLPLRNTGVIFRRLLSTTTEVIPTKTSPPTKTPLKLLDLNVPYPKHIENTFSLATANQEEITQHRISLAIAKYKKHDSDTGSAIVQLAVMTEKIYNLARHFAMHKKDKAGGRGFQVRKRITAILHMSVLISLLVKYSPIYCHLTVDRQIYLQMLLARRRKMMKYLRDKNFEEYREAVKVLKLEREAIHLQ